MYPLRTLFFFASRILSPEEFPTSLVLDLTLCVTEIGFSLKH